jgi:hypothetical protein
VVVDPGEPQVLQCRRVDEIQHVSSGFGGGHYA